MLERDFVQHKAHQRFTIVLTSSHAFAFRNVIRFSAAAISLGVTAFILFGVSYQDMVEINNILEKLLTESLKNEQEKLSKAQSISSSYQKVVLVGMVDSLNIFQENKLVGEAISSFCTSYSTKVPGGGERSLNIEILYRQESYFDGVNVSTALRDKFEKCGCSVSLMPEEELLANAWRRDYGTLTRYQRMGWLRSLHRESIIENALLRGINYEIVVNMDLDIISPPTLNSLIRSINQVTTENRHGNGLIVCANGYETWYLLGTNGFVRKLFYDTLAAIDVNGDWLHKSYTTNLMSVLMFGQTVIFRNILQHQTGLWPMQSCFGGVAVYDYQTWSYAECDYSPNHIRKASKADQLKILVSEHQATIAPKRWKLNSDFTLSGTLGGDACEHVVFQQCVYHASHELKAYRSIGIGIQADLVVEREAAIMTRVEDFSRLMGTLGGLILLLFACLAVLYLCFSTTKRYMRRFF